MDGGEANKDYPKGLNQGMRASKEKSERETKTVKMSKLSGVSALPFTYIAHVLEVVAAVLVLVWNIHFRGGIAWDSTNKSYIFNLHPVLMVIGFLILGSEAIMSFKGLPFNKEVNKKIHLSLHLIALVLGIWGISAAFKFHNESGIDNLYSLHSWVGLGTICLYGIQWLFGFVTYFYPGGSQALRRAALPWHALFGLFVYILALAAAQLGFLEKLTFLENSGLLKYSAEAFLVNFTALVVILLGASVVISAATPAHSEDPHSYSSISDA